MDFGGFATDPLAVADVNHDGYLDILAFDFSTNTLDVLPGQGDGSFQAPKRSPLTGGSLGGYQMAVADFNGDGNADVAIVGSSLNLLLGNGDGTFQPDQLLSLNLEASEVTSADLNHDGKADLLAAGFSTDGESAVAIFIGNGDGTFQAERDFPIGDTLSYFIAVADFDQDGNLDVATDGQDDGVGILFGNGDGTFQAAVQVPLSAYPGYLVSGDFNGDGRADLAVQVAGTDPRKSTIALLLNNGDGTFQPEHDYGSMTMITGLTTGDLNGDGITDLAIVSQAEGGVMILPGSSSGTFGIPSFAMTLPQPSGLAAGELDADGLDDLVTLSSKYHHASVLRHGQAVLSQTFVNFGNIPIGKQKTSPITITNSGSAPITITKTEVIGDYSQAFTHTAVCDGVTIQPGGSCTLQVSLAPTNYRPPKAFLVITSDGAPGTQSVVMRGSVVL